MYVSFLWSSLPIAISCKIEVCFLSPIQFAYYHQLRLCKAIPLGAHRRHYHPRRNAKKPESKFCKFWDTNLQFLCSRETFLSCEPNSLKQFIVEFEFASICAGLSEKYCKENVKKNVKKKCMSVGHKSLCFSWKFSENANARVLLWV